MRLFILFSVLGLLTINQSRAHQQPTTLIALSPGSESITAKLQIPLSELELAFGHQVTLNPEQTLAVWGPSFETYLKEHIRPVSEGAKPWRLQLQFMQIQAAEQTQAGKFQEVFVQLTLIPPPGASPRAFTLHYDLIMHQVVTHRAIVSMENDWAAGRIEPAQIGLIAYDQATARIPPLEINLGAESRWAGFTAMVRFGMHHIEEGLDHLLFLMLLLLPATLTANGRRWGAFGGSRQSLIRLIGIVSAFSLGHSLTLLAGALHWLRLPQQPVEVLIAISILVSAAHAIRPLFHGRELWVASGFGLVHGLAFATMLSGLQLEAGSMALAILGFNLGIELMQLFVIAVTVPWLILLSLTPAHSTVRVGGALLASVAALGWIANRVSGNSNSIERAMTTLTDYAPFGVLILAMIAIPSYLIALQKTVPERLPN